MASSEARLATAWRRATLPGPSSLPAVLTALLLAACGADAPAPAADAEVQAEAADGADEESGGAPVIESLALRPEQPSIGEPIVAEVAASDPDGDVFDVEVDWYVNDKLARDSAQVRFDTSSLKRGDVIHAVIRVTDGNETVEGTTGQVTVGNTRPRVSEVRILPSPPRTAQTTYAEASATDADGDQINLQYEWRIDDEVLPDVTGPSLPPGLPRRGQRLRVRACGSDESGPGECAESAEVRVGNSEPSITSEPPSQFAGPLRYEYQLTAKDPDGDKPLRYELIQGPAGMDVDLITGFVTWRVPRDANGKFPVKLGVSDLHGGVATQVYDIRFEWQEVPAGKSPAAPRRDEDGDED